MHIFPLNLGGALVLLTELARANPPPEPVLPQIVMATLCPVSSNPRARAHAAIYAEAFRRLGYEMVTVNLPPARASAQAEANQIDGELTRGALYGRLHPHLVRLDQQVYNATLAAYSVTAITDIAGWTSLRNKDYRVEYRSGIAASHYGLGAAMPALYVSSVPTTLQGLKKLATRRTDIYIDFEEHVKLQLQQRSNPDIGRIIKVGTMEQVRIHAYLSAKNKALASRLSGVLKQMKQEGVSDAYRRAATADTASK